MLQQILKDMYVDPEILEELSDDQKQILFFKMREEQIRRWNVWEQKLSEEEKLKPKVNECDKRRVHFNCNEDLSLIIDIITEPDEDEIRKKQEGKVFKLVEKRKELEAINNKGKESTELKQQTESKVELNFEEKCVSEKDKHLKLEEESVMVQVDDDERNDNKAHKEQMEMILEKKTADDDELAGEEEKCKEQLYEIMRKEEEQLKNEIEESNRLEEEWKEREKKAKEADKLRRNSFTHGKKEFERMQKLAKEKVELEKLRKPVSQCEGTQKDTEQFAQDLSTTDSSTESVVNPNPISIKNTGRPTISMPLKVTSTRDECDMIPVKKELVRPSRPAPSPSSKENIHIEGNTNYKKQEVISRKDSKPNKPPRPKSKNEVIKWYKEIEYAKLSGLSGEKNPMEWFHGVITRQESESLLGNKKQGSYLVRVSERVWGYTISYKDIGRCKHFLIDTLHGGYQFFGMDQMVHQSLNELIDYHTKNPISGLGREILVYPCGQEKSPPDYEHLLRMD